MSQFPFDNPIRAAQGARASKLARARELIRARKFPESLALLEPVLRIDPSNDELLLLTAMTYLEMGRFDQAAALCTRALSGTRKFDAYMMRAGALRGLGKTDEALSDYHRAEQIVPGHPEMAASIVTTLEQAGRFAEAQNALEAAMKQSGGKVMPPALASEQAKLLVHAGKLQEAVAVIDSVELPQSQRGTPFHLGLLFLRAKACDKAGNYAEAWKSAQEAHSVSRVAFDPSLLVRLTDMLIGFWTPDRVRQLGDSGVTDATPVFISGMPRSGTTLADQIIHAHPSGAGVGELNLLEVYAAGVEEVLHLGKGPSGAASQGRCAEVAGSYLRQIRMMAPGAERVSNKALGNTRFLPHLARTFPATRIIHMVRDPRDIAVSCFLGAFNSARVPWVARPDWVALAWKESERLMAHWQGVLALPVLRMRYETLVSEGEVAIRKLVEHVGLTWDPAVLNFHGAQRTVKTLSYDQVNKPLYTTSAGRWQNYQPFLQDVDWPAL